MNSVKKMAWLLFSYSIDIILLNLSYLLSLLLRFEGKIDLQYLDVYKSYFIHLTLIKLVVFTYLRIYKNQYKYASIKEVVNISFAVLAGNALTVSFLTLMQSHLPRSVYIIVVMLDIIFIGGSRLLARVALQRQFGKGLFQGNFKRILVIGGGDAGAMVIREYKNHTSLQSKPVAIIDDNKSKKGTSINGVPIVGQRQDIVEIVEKLRIDEIVISIPSANKAEIREIVNECKHTKAKIKIVPGIYELIDGTVSIKNIRDIDIKDILGRDEVKLDITQITEYIEGKVIIVTGAGGSIGSELCRQIASFKPRRLVLLDIYENGVFGLDNELKAKYEDLDILVKVASVRDRQELEEKLNPNGLITVFQVEEKLRVEQVAIPYETEVITNIRLDKGIENTLQEGKDGFKRSHIKDIYINGEFSSSVIVLDTIASEPQSKVIEKGANDIVSTSRGDTPFREAMIMSATAYDLSYASTGKNPGDKYYGITASGTTARPGTVAVDPRVIPLGTKLYVESLDGTSDYGFAIAEDKGSAIKGKKIDLFFTSNRSAMNFGRRNVKVYILK